MTIKNYIDRAFEVMGLSALREYKDHKVRWLTGTNDEDNIIDDHYESFYGLREPKVPVWRKVLWVFKDNRSLRDQVTKLQRDLLVYKQLAQDTGRAGLNLFDENEALHVLVKDLRRQLEDPIEYKEGILFWKEMCDRSSKEVKELAKKCDILERSNARIMEVVNDDIREKLKDL